MSREKSAIRYPMATILALAFLAGCRSVWVRGVIQTADEKPIANASVTIRSGDPAAHTLSGSSESNGCFDLFETIGRHQSGYVLVVDSPGYKPMSIPVAIHIENLLIVTLEPLASSNPSEARPISSSERHLRYGPCEPEVSAGSLTLH